MYIKYDDLPSTAEVEKLDPLSRYVNDDDLVQVHDTNLIQLQYNDLPSTDAVEKLDPLSRYVNDDDIWNR